MGKEREKERGKNKRGDGERWGQSGQGGGAALYGQDSARKAGGESRDVIPQLYPAVTVGGERRRGREERRRTRDRGEGEEGHGRNKKEKEETL